VTFTTESRSDGGEENMEAVWIHHAGTAW